MLINVAFMYSNEDWLFLGRANNAQSYTLTETTQFTH